MFLDEFDHIIKEFLSTPSARRATMNGKNPEPTEKIFLSTPSARRATGQSAGCPRHTADFYPRPPRGGRRYTESRGRSGAAYFYPRPPRGGRQRALNLVKEAITFLSTPSARRATSCASGTASAKNDFYPRPPRGGRRYAACGRDGHTGISIHALREEGDDLIHVEAESEDISIHALREEGDSKNRDKISIFL